MSILIAVTAVLLVAALVSDRPDVAAKGIMIGVLFGALIYEFIFWGLM